MTILPQCLTCVHLQSGKPMKCDAFPDGIPTPILLNDVDHREPYPGDHGIWYEEILRGT